MNQRSRSREVKPRADRLLIIAGAPKCGTTALYQYLSAHPAIAPSLVKEPRFFLPPEQEGRRALKPGSGFEAYLSLFPEDNESLLMEASTEYFFFEAAFRDLMHMAPRARVMLVLRDPVERLGSWFVHRQRSGGIPANRTFESWCRAALAGEEKDEVSAPGGPGLTGGRYSPWIERALRHVPRDQLLFIWSRDLEASPAEVMAQVGRFAGIDDAFYQSYEFTRRNPSRSVRSHWLEELYRGLSYQMQSRLKKLPRLRNVLRAVKRVFVEPVYWRFNRAPAPGVELSAATRRDLARYYLEDAKPLEALVGEPPPWRSKLTLAAGDKTSREPGVRES